jgi:hypothetical protein
MLILLLHPTCNIQYLALIIRLPYAHYHNDNTYILVTILSLMVKVHRINEVEYNSHDLQAIPHASI